MNEHFQTATHIFLSALKEERFFSSKGLNQRADYVIIIAIVELITESRGAEGGGVRGSSPLPKRINFATRNDLPLAKLPGSVTRDGIKSCPIFPDIAQNVSK